MKPHITIRIIRDEVGGYYYTMFGTNFIMPYKMSVRDTSLSALIRTGLSLDEEYIAEDCA